MTPSRRYIQAGVLLFMLALPACIFIFLHLFGKNRYTLPYHGRYQINTSGDTLYLPLPDSLRPPNTCQATILYVAQASNNRAHEQWQRLNNLLNNEPDVCLYRILPLDSIRLHWLYTEPEQWKQQPFVLLDTRAHIRGYYGDSIEEFDRLFTEVRIALQL